MKRKTFLVLVIMLPVLAFMAVPGAHALCSDAPVPGVDYDGCDLSGLDFTGADLTNAILTDTNLNGTNFTGAILSGADMSSTAPATYTGTIFNSATIDGLILGNLVLFLTDFTYAIGSPDVTSTISIFGACPLPGTFSQPQAPFCPWEPTAVALAGIGVTAVPDLLPGLLTTLLLAATAGIFVARRLKKSVEVPAQR